MNALTTCRWTSARARPSLGGSWRGATSSGRGSVQRQAGLWPPAPGDELLLLSSLLSTSSTQPTKRHRELLLQLLPMEAVPPSPPWPGAQQLLPHPTPRSTFKARKFISAPFRLLFCSWFPALARQQRDAGWEHLTLPVSYSCSLAKRGAERPCLSTARRTVERERKGVSLEGLFVFIFLYQNIYTWDYVKSFSE